MKKIEGYEWIRVRGKNGKAHLVEIKAPWENQVLDSAICNNNFYYDKPGKSALPGDIKCKACQRILEERGDKQ